jgi:hypothetical protein
MHWTKAPAARLGIPKVSFFGISAFAQVMREVHVRHDPCATLRPDDVDDMATRPPSRCRSSHTSSSPSKTSWRPSATLRP